MSVCNSTEYKTALWGGLIFFNFYDRAEKNLVKTDQENYKSLAISQIFFGEIKLVFLCVNVIQQSI